MLTRRKLLATAPATALGISLTSAPAQAATYKDIKPTSPLYTEITWALDRGLFSGYPDGIFRPAATVNGQELARVIYAYRGKPAYTPPVRSPFVDVFPEQPYYKEIMWLVNQGVAIGDWDKAYHPTDGVERGLLAAYLYRMAGEPTYSPVFPRSYFTDVPTDHPYFKEICFIKDCKITAGWPGGYYYPSKVIQRATVCAFLYRYNQIFGY